ncbi:YpfJ protein, zinc metalloprotease superfamily [Klebsiella pneumoniae]|uniref:YpfJ protein, zinc metalloprotease superfamily n=1 Tax=Klebsiella pneumoniae TaxID=573 RepID=A0A378AGE3_KLEPN|nr:YpfJ protein, zinc metalloprotease superfamily [Klebsiella pneumoniae]
MKRRSLLPSFWLHEDTWGPIFEKMGRQYPQPKLVLYRGATRTGCGTGQSVMGPFYCPADSTVYIDLSFYDEMKNKLGADGDFAQGYVIAHEVGHHVQKLLGIERRSASNSSMPRRPKQPPVG